MTQPADADNFPPILSDYDLYLLGEGTDRRLYDKLGAHVRTVGGVRGTAFVVFAPVAYAIAHQAALIVS